MESSKQFMRAMARGLHSFLYDKARGAARGHAGHVGRKTSAVGFGDPTAMARNI